MTLTTLAKASGVALETIRYYQRRKLLPPPLRSLEGRPQYDETHLVRLRFIKSVQQIGFSLEEIDGLLQLEGAKCDRARKVSQAKLKDIRERIAGLQRVESLLSGLITQCERHTDNCRCPLIDTLHKELGKG